MDFGYSRKMAERDADAWMEHLGGSGPEEPERKDWVSGNPLERLGQILRKGIRRR